MSLKKTIHFGIPAYKWGNDGKPYMYREDTKGAKERAKNLALADGEIEKAKLKAKKDAEKKAEKAKAAADKKADKK